MTTHPSESAAAEHSSTAREVPVTESETSLCSASSPPVPHFAESALVADVSPVLVETANAESPAESAQSAIGETERGSSSSARPLSAPVEPVLRPRTSEEPQPSVSIHPSASRILVVSELHGVIDCDQFLRWKQGKREETEGTVTVKNKQAVRRLLESAPEVQLGILSYIGRRNFEKRHNCIEAIIELNEYLQSKGCNKMVGLKFTDRPEDKSAVVARVNANGFVDDKFATVNQTVNDLWHLGHQCEVFFPSEFPSRNRYFNHCRSFEEFVNQVIQSGLLPRADDPAWITEFPPPDLTLSKN